jgi:putative transposase
MKYPVVQTLTGQGFKVRQVCGIVGVTRSGFYRWLKVQNNPGPNELRRRNLSHQILAVHSESRNAYGVRRIQAELKFGRRVVVNRKMIWRLMRESGITGLPNRRKYRSKANLATSTDMLNRNFDKGEINQVWATDITQHWTAEGFLYCAAVIDTHSRRIVGWAIDSSQTSKLVTSALDMAITNRKPIGTIIHSDHGSQFTSWAFSQRVREAGLTPSMGTIGDGYDNAPIESFWGRMQTELLDTKKWATRAELASAIFSYIEIFHNRQRRHSSLGYLSPVEYENLKTLTTTVVGK